MLMQDELSCLTFMNKYGMPERINTEVFISMAKVRRNIQATCRGVHLHGQGEKEYSGNMPRCSSPWPR
jgi:hypothetical protein